MRNLYRQELKYADDKAGEFKKGDYTIGLFEVGATAGEVEEKMKELSDEANGVKITEDNVYKLVTYLHNWICWIHPFADGNGVVARFLVNYFLVINSFSPAIFKSEKKDITMYINKIY